MHTVINIQFINILIHWHIAYIVYTLSFVQCHKCKLDITRIVTMQLPMGKETCNYVAEVNYYHISVELVLFCVASYCYILFCLLFVLFNKPSQPLKMSDVTDMSS